MKYLTPISKGIRWKFCAKDQPAERSRKAERFHPSVHLSLPCLTLSRHCGRTNFQRMMGKCLNGKVGREGRDYHLHPWMEEGPSQGGGSQPGDERGVTNPSTNPHEWILESEPANINPLRAQLDGLCLMSARMVLLTEEEVHVRLLEFVTTLKNMIDMRGRVNPNLRCTKMTKQVWAERYRFHKCSELSKCRLNKRMVFNPNPNKWCNIIGFNESSL